jgi:hypothetical protein
VTYGRRFAAVAATAALVLASCRTEIDPDWVESMMPVPGGPPGRVAVRDAVHCGDSWWAVGGVVLHQPTDTQDARPAAWRSTDGTTWEALPVTATTYWGRRAILSGIACSDDTVVAIGARSGGAHGNPRVTTFFEKDGGLDDRRAPFNLYGGATATNVGPLAGAAPGWLITGNRTSGPAVWHSTDGRDFTLEEDVPGLADEDGFTSLAQAAAWDGAQWVVVGGGNASGTLDREPVEWTSPDGRAWARGEVPGTGEFDDLERVVAAEGGLVALGLRGDAFGAWRRGDDGWQAAEDFGSLPDDATRSPFVATLVTGTTGLWATTSDGADYALWHSDDGDGWSPVRLPAEPPATAGEHVLAVATYDDVVLLLADDGEGGRVWSARD